MVIGSTDLAAVVRWDVYAERRGPLMSEPSSGKNAVWGSADEAVRYYKKDFWSKENLKFSEPHYRLEKSARIVNRIAGRRERTLLDVGCGPAALRSLLRPNIGYHGIDIAIQEPAPYLLEADLVETPVRFGDRKFDIVMAQGFFEYIGEHQAQKFSEIAQVLRADGTFVATYTNFGHRDRKIYWPYSNVQPMSRFRASLAEHFEVRRFFPASHNWNHGQPSKPIIRAGNMHVNVNVPVLSPLLAVEYFLICIPRARGPSPA